MNSDQPSREQIEARLTALLLGELPAEEAALLRYTIARDPALKKLHDELQATFALVREAEKTPTEAPVEKPAPLKFSDERREKLLAHFKTPRPQGPPKEPLFWLKGIRMPSRRSTLVTAFVILFILGIAAVSIPNFVKARSTSAANSIINNLRQIDAAKNQWALEKKKSASDIPAPNDLTPYLVNGQLPKPVMGEQYKLGNVSDPVRASKEFAIGSKVYSSDGSITSRGTYGPEPGLVQTLRSRVWGPAEPEDRPALSVETPPREMNYFASGLDQARIDQALGPGKAPQVVTAALSPQIAASPSVQIVLPSSQPEMGQSIVASTAPSDLLPSLKQNPGQLVANSGALQNTVTPGHYLDYGQSPVPSHSSTMSGAVAFGATDTGKDGSTLGVVNSFGGGGGMGGGFGGARGVGDTLASTAGEGKFGPAQNYLYADVGTEFDKQHPVTEGKPVAIGQVEELAKRPNTVSLALDDSEVSRRRSISETRRDANAILPGASVATATTLPAETPAPVAPSAPPMVAYNFYSSAQASLNENEATKKELADRSGGQPSAQALTGSRDNGDTKSANRFYRTLTPEPKNEPTLNGTVSGVPSRGMPAASPTPPPPPATVALPQPVVVGAVLAFDSDGNRGEGKQKIAASGQAPAGTSPNNSFVGRYSYVATNAIALNAKEAFGVDYISNYPSLENVSSPGFSVATANVDVPAKTIASTERLPQVGLKQHFEQQSEDIKLAQDKVERLRSELHITDGNPYVVNPTPTLDAMQLQLINQQRVEGEKVYNEQLAQLQELKSMQKTNPEQLREVLPLVASDSNLSDMLGRLHSAKQDYVSKTQNYSTSNIAVVRVQSLMDELDRQIDDRVTGIMAGLETQAASTKAATDALVASVEAAKVKDQQNQPYYDAARDLDQKIRIHQLLASKIEAEKLDLNPTKAIMIQITDPAEPAKGQTFWQKMTGQYASTARIKVENDVTDIPGMMSAGPSASEYDPYFIQTTFEIMKSAQVLSNVVQGLDLQSAWAKQNGGRKLDESQAIDWLRDRLDLASVKNTKLVAISAKSESPQEAADIANAVAEAYGKYLMESRKVLTTNGIAVLEQQYLQLTRDIKTNQEYVENLRRSFGIVDEAKPTNPAPAPKQLDVPIRKPSTNAPIPQPEILTSSNAFSTFSLNVSDVSFKFAEASLQNGKLPDTASIRSEEFINAFDYRDPEAAAGQPMAFAAERARYPYAHNRELLRFSIKTAALGRQAGRALNLVLLLDVSGSMERADRVGIIHEALRSLGTQLQPQDTVSVVTFSRTARLWADGVSGDKAADALNQIGGITPEGGTNLEEAMRLAYDTAHRHYLPNGMNRVVLLTDGAANLGNVEPAALKEKVEAQRKQGIALDCFGIGWEDFNDDLLEQLSSNGDGRYAFLNSPEDASKEFAAKLAGALQVAASDVKVQVEFNPARVISYRQIGYAKHQLTKEQFRDNTVDAAEIASQEAGNALYTVETNPNGNGPVATVRVRYKVPATQIYRELSWDVAYTGNVPAMDQASPAMRLACTASAFSEWLAASPYAPGIMLDELLRGLSGVPEVYGADTRPKQLETMIREARSLEGK